MKILAVPPSKIQNRAVTKYELERYFHASSVESLIAVLRECELIRLFSFDILISTEYIDQEESKHRIVAPAEFGVDLGYANPYKLYDLSNKIKNGNALNEIEIKRVIVELRQETLGKYLRFRLYNIDYQELRSHVRPKSRVINKDEDYEYITYNGLTARGARITYHGTPVHLAFQHRQVVRTFLKRPDTLLAPDIFMDDPDIFDPDKYYNNARDTLSKLIPAVHKKLREVIGKECVFNEPNEGWRLKIE